MFVAWRKPEPRPQPMATDLQMWTLANLHLVKWRQMTLPRVGPIKLPMIGKRDVASVIKTMRRRRWIAFKGSLTLAITVEGQRVLEASRLDPWKLVWC